MRVYDMDSRSQSVCQSVNDPHIVTFDNLWVTQACCRLLCESRVSIIQSFFYNSVLVFGSFEHHSFFNSAIIVIHFRPARSWKWDLRVIMELFQNLLVNFYPSKPLNLNPGTSQKKREWFSGSFRPANDYGAVPDLHMIMMLYPDLKWFCMGPPQTCKRISSSRLPPNWLYTISTSCSWIFEVMSICTTIMQNSPFIFINSTITWSNLIETSSREQNYYTALYSKKSANSSKAPSKYRYTPIKYQIDEVPTTYAIMDYDTMLTVLCVQDMKCLWILSDYVWTFFVYLKQFIVLNLLDVIRSRYYNNLLQGYFVLYRNDFLPYEVSRVVPSYVN